MRRECCCFYLCRTLVRLLPCVSILEVEAFGVEFCEALYSVAQTWADEPWFSHAISSISVKCELVYIFYTKIMTFLLSRKGIPMAMAELSMQVSSRMYFLMLRSGLSAHDLRMSALA